MPLRDLFHPPLSDLWSYGSLHGDWITMLTQWLNSQLPERYLAHSHAHLGPKIEVDIGAYERPLAHPVASGNGVSTATAVWSPPETTLSADVDFLEVDFFEVQITYLSVQELVAAIEVVSPRNKDRPESRTAFARKCASYLAKGVSLVVIDVVTHRLANMHNELVTHLGSVEPLRWSPPTHLQAVSYRILPVNDRFRLNAWPYELKVGEALPAVPLWLAPDLVVPLELEPTYEAACRGLRIP